VKRGRRRCHTALATAAQAASGGVPSVWVTIGVDVSLWFMVGVDVWAAVDDSVLRGEGGGNRSLFHLGKALPEHQAYA
jgi:hypothetical protein